MSIKKYIPVLLVLIMVLTTNPAYANEEIQVYVDDTQIKFDASPMIRDGRLLVPFRPFAEALGASVSWDSTHQKVTVRRDDTLIELTVGSKSARMNEEVILLETVPTISNNRVFIPLRFVGDSLEAIVSWDEQSRTVTVSQKLLYSDEDEILSVVNQLFTEKDPEEYLKLFTDYLIIDQFEGEEALESNFGNFTESNVKLIETVLYELRDSFAEVYFSTKEEHEPNLTLFSVGYMILEEVDGSWKIGLISDDLKIYPDDQKYTDTETKPKRNEEIDEGVRTSILATMQQYIESVEEGNREKLFGTLDENQQRSILIREEDFGSTMEEAGSVTFEYYHIDVLQTNGQLAYVKFTFRSNGEAIDFRTLYMLKNTENGWKIHDQFVFEEPFPVK
ncbi:MAG: stalk domain-containing protein [Paenibacillaceae bacterium]